MATSGPQRRKRKLEVPPKTVYQVDDFKTYEWSSEEDADPVVEQEYYRQIRDSSGFDLNMRIPYGSFLPFKLKDEDLPTEIGICARVGLHWHNFQKGSNLQLLRLVKYNSCLRGLCAYYITMEVMDPAENSHLTFQTCVVRAESRKNEDYKISTEVCRIKPKPNVSGDEDWHWDNNAIDDFHNAELEWLSDNALTQSGDKRKQYYQVPESEIQKNDWLTLYAEYALHSLRGRGLTNFTYDVSLTIKKVVVQTPEDVESSNKLKSENAVFYISFGDREQTEEHRAIVRRITDGILGHVSLEVKVTLGDL